MAAPGPYGGGPTLPPPCANHPHVGAVARCTHCGGAFCAACIVEFRGQAHCGPCRDRRLRWMQPPAKKPSTYAQYREALLVVVVLVGGVGAFLLRIYLSSGAMLPAVIGVGLVLLLLLAGVGVLHYLAKQEGEE